MDVLSDTLGVVRLAGAIFFTAKFAAPWAITSPPSEMLAQILKSRADCITLFHVVVSGRCCVTLEDQTSFQISAGDVIILPHGDPHTMGSQRDLQPAPLTAILSPMSEGIPAVEYGGAGEETRLICGYLLCDRHFNPLIGSLPPLLWVRREWVAQSYADGTAGVLPPWCIVAAAGGDWLDVTLRYTIDEAGGERPGSAVMLARLTELLFVEVLRRYMQQLPPEYGGWLAAVRDPDVGQALRLMHAHPERPWTVEELANAVAISRSALAQRFTALMGEPPMRYLLTWRMQLAQYLLRQTTLSITEITLRVGYESEVAFTRAFKRMIGQPPAAWRRQIGVPVA